MERVEFDYWKPRDVARLLSLVEAERRYFQEMMAMLPVGVALATPAMDLTLTNRSFRRTLGIERETVADRKLDDLLGIAGLADRVRETLTTRTARSILNPATPTPRGPRSLLVTFQPFREWDDESVPELLITLEDVTDLVNAQLAAAPAAAGREIEGQAAPAPPPLPTPTMASARAKIMAKLGHLPGSEAPATAAPAAKPAAGLTWRLNTGTMALASVEKSAAIEEILPKDAWQAGADFWSGRVVPAHLPLVKSFYEQVIAGLPLHSVEYRAATPAGRNVWLRDSVRVWHDEYGVAAQIEGSTVEVTHLRQREDSMAQALKVDALTRLAGRVAHECNNLLTILGGHGEELLHTLSPDNPLRANAQEILTAGDRLSAFTRQLSTFVKHPTPEMSSIDVDALLGGYKDDLKQLLPSSIRFLVNLKAPAAVAFGDPALVSHALRTFTLRGAEAMRGEGTLSIETACVTAADPTAASRAALPAGRYVQLAIRDTGHAIHPDLLQHLFEPPAGEETPRHNLAAIYKSVRDMGGDVMVTSEFDRGTSFTILLPRAADAVPPPAAEAPPAEAAPPPAAAAPPRVDTILVVEDEAGIRGLIRRILSRQNYEILEASNGRQALDLAREHQGKIDMLLTDVVMPEMGGFDLAQELLKDRPETKVLFISGYTGLAGFDPAQLPAGSGFLQKPFTLNALLAKVREVFGPAAA